MRELPFSLPPTVSNGAPPVWTGDGFDIGGERHSIACYWAEALGWTDELTAFHENETGEHHYIDKASRRHALNAIKRYVTAKEPVIMDIGCSSGFMIADLRRELPAARVLGSDVVLGPLQALAKKHPDLPLLQFDLTDCPVPANSLDATILLNVLEHIEKHELAAQHVFRILKPGGLAVIELPAGPELYDVYDKQLLHYRRYKLPELRAMLEGVGFEIAGASHLGFFLYPAFAFVKKRNQKYLSLPDEEQRKIVKGNIQTMSFSPLMNGIMAVEEALRYSLPFPAGIRCLALARKPGRGGV